MGPIGAPAPGPTNVVVLSKIPEGATEQQIAAGAGRPDEVLEVSFRPADPEGPGWAIIAFASPEIAKIARERLDGKPLLGMPAGTTLEAALGEGLYGKVRGSSDQDSPWKEARTTTGQVYYYHHVTRQTTWIKPPMDMLVAPGRSAIIRASVNPVGQAQAAIQAAQALVAASHGGGSGGDSTGSTASGPVGANLFVYHIPNSWDDGILRQHFEHFGNILSCRIQKDDNGRPRGFGFVSYDAPTGAQAAIAGMHGFPVEGKWLKVQLKKGDEQQMDKGSIGGPSLPGFIDEGQMKSMSMPPPPPPMARQSGGAPPPPPPPPQRPGPY